MCLLSAPPLWKIGREIKPLARRLGNLLMKKNPFSNANTAKTAGKEGYEDVISNTDRNHETDAQLVAALFIASGPGRGIYISSIPKGPTEAKMNLADAPAWAHQVGSRTPQDFHAEDGAMWLFESNLSQSNKVRAGDQYPHGSTMYVYGQFAPKSGDRVAPAYKSPYNIALTVDLDCTTVLRNLDIMIGSF